MTINHGAILTVRLKNTIALVVSGQGVEAVAVEGKGQIQARRGEIPTRTIGQEDVDAPAGIMVPIDPSALSTRDTSCSLDQP